MIFSCGNIVIGSRLYSLRFVMLKNVGCVFPQIESTGQNQSH